MEDSQLAAIQEATRKQGSEVNPDGSISMGKVTSTTGIKWVWDTRSYEKIPVLDYMLLHVLSKRRDDGSFRFTMNDPGKLPIKGQLKCMLHADDSQRKHFDELGFTVCKMEGISNKHQLLMHMKRKHPVEWETIELEKKEREREEDRALQRLLLASQAKTVEQAKPLEQEAFTTTNQKFVCPKCGADFTYEKVYKNHVKECTGGK